MNFDHACGSDANAADSFGRGVRRALSADVVRLIGRVGVTRIVTISLESVGHGSLWVGAKTRRLRLGIQHWGNFYTGAETLLGEGRSARMEGPPNA